MKLNLKQLIKTYLYSRYSPNLVSDFYFQKKDATNRKQLVEMLESKTDLMNAVNEEQRGYWQSRIDKVLKAAENKNIPRNEMAGTLVNGNLIMHNGIKIDPLSYYSFPLLKMLIDNKGVHEPEEERVFQEVTKCLNTDRKLTMLELGCYWSFYSMWFLSMFPNANCLMIEPNKKNLFYGRKNFELNNFKGQFIHAGIGKVKNNGLNVLSVDEICQSNNVDFLDILHSDIQGYELEMLKGSTRMISQDKVGYVFISTHSNDLHLDCKAFLENYGFTEVVNVDLDESSSWDGILVMKSPNYSGIENVDIEKNSGQ